MPETFTIGVRPDGAIDGPGEVVEVVGELDLASAPELRRLLLALIERSGAPIVVDVRGVTFCDSTGLGTIVDAHRAAEARGAVLVLSEPSAHLRRILAITCLDRVLHLR